MSRDPVRDVEDFADDLRLFFALVIIGFCLTLAALAVLS